MCVHVKRRCDYQGGSFVFLYWVLCSRFERPLHFEAAAQKPNGPLRTFAISATYLPTDLFSTFWGVSR
jgi:hypothetical protein